MVWPIKKQFCQKELGQFGEKTPLNRQSQMMADCAQILIWVSVSGDKAPTA